ncbi:MAG: thioesterase [Candidatus Marinimicrobia bacterium]|jgi:acyl-CoA thioesterase|nr:thioesterase [Candidatus Neomarinimicrobiota bacterium]|tara:strand:- start:198 stop:614 length:417 start_codon:yes stop_codon:yes gene_type:complete
MNDTNILKSLQSDSAPCTETLGAKVINYSSKPPLIEMEFEAVHNFTHSNGQVVQGGFVTGMLDAPMAHLLMGLFDFKIIPMTLDINVSFLAPTRQGKLNCIAEVLQLGKSTAFMTSKLYQKGGLVASATSTVRLVPRS